MKIIVNKFIMDSAGWLPKPNNLFFDMILQMSLLMLLVMTNDIPLQQIFIPLFIIPALLFKKVRNSLLFWLILLFYLLYFYVFMGTNRYVPNHKYLYVFYILLLCIIIYIKKSTNDWFEILKTSAQYMIGFVFLLATVGKFLAPEFLNGSFFEFTLLTDERFSGFTQSIVGIQNSDLNIGFEEFNKLLRSNSLSHEAQLPTSEKLHFISIFLSYWTILIEGSIAITFLSPAKSFGGKYRNWVLLIFIITTYPIATVPGFAILLTLLAFITSKSDTRPNVWSYVYIGIFIIIPIFKFPFLAALKILN